MGMMDAGSNKFRYLENARKFALERPGNDRIVKQGNQYLVEEIPRLEGQGNLIPNVIDLNGKQLESQLKLMAQQPKGSALETVEFLLDGNDDGSFLPDRRFSVEKGEIKESQYSVNGLSDVLRSPEDKGLEILREAISQNHSAALLKLSPRMIEAILSSEQITPEEKAYAQQKLDSAQAKSAQALFKQFFGQDDTLAAAGVRDYDELLQRLNKPENRENLNQLLDIAHYPEGFQGTYQGRDTELANLAHTLLDLPGFRRYPSSQSNGVAPDLLKTRQRAFDNALRTIKQYDYKLQLTHGMQFNKEGISSHNTQIDYRLGGQVFSLGFSGRDFDLNSNWQQGFGFASQADAAQRLRLGYNSGSFDLKFGLAKDMQGKLVFERPESESTDRFIARTGEQAQDWAKEHPWITAGIAAAAAGGAYAYSLANPEQDLALSFNQRFDLLDKEFLRVKGEISPEVHLKGGAMDLGVKRVGVGASGNIRDHSYDLSARHYFQDSTLRSGEIHNEATELSLRYGYGSHSLTLDNRYSYASSQLDTRIGYRKNFIHSASFDSYVAPYAQLKDGDYQNAGISAGISKDFGGMQLQLNADYNQQSGVSGGFQLVKQFNW